MKKHTLKSITLRNFKGKKNLRIDFNENGRTFIKGDNEEGKTTILDAWIWLIRDRDSFGRTNFGIKTTLPNGEVIPKLEHEVSAEIIIDGAVRTFRKTLVERWSKKRGSMEEEFSGNDTNYFIDEVPYKKSDFNKEIETFFLSEEKAQLLSDVMFFNSLHWEKQRIKLIEISPKVNDNDIFEKMAQQGESSQGAIDKIKAVLSTSKTLDLYKKEVQHKYKAIKDELEYIPIRIDEATRSIMDDVPTEDLEKQINTLQDSITVIESLIEKKRNDKNTEIENKRNALMKANEQKFQLQLKIDNARRSNSELLSSKFSEVSDKIEALNRKAMEFELTIAELEKKNESEKWFMDNNERIKEEAKKEYKDLDEKQFSFSAEMSCPSCERPFDVEKIQEQRELALINFNTSKVAKLNAIEFRIKENEKHAVKCQNAISENNIKIIGAKTRLSQIKEEITELFAEKEDLSNRIKRLKPSDELLSLEKEMSELVIDEDVSASPEHEESISVFFTQKENKQKECAELKSKLAVNTQNAKYKERVKELQSQQSELNQNLLSLELMNNTILKFEKMQMQTIEDSVNQMFSYVKFRLFETQVNGVEVQTCKCMVNGVNYQDVNTAGRINAGVDIINTFSKAYGLLMPVFIDNKESVSNVIHTDSQLILLEVLKGSKLKVEFE